MKSIFRAKKILNLIKIYFVIITILGDIFVFRNGVALGVYRTLVSCIPLIAILTMLDSITEGSKKDIQKISALLGLGIMFGVYSIINSFQNVFFLTLICLQTTSYIAIILYLLLSKDIRKLHNYNEMSDLQKWIWNWSGEIIGYISNGNFFNENGSLIGKFFENELYSADGYYIGEICSNGRIGVDKKKVNTTRDQFIINDIGQSYKKRNNISSLVLYSNINDFRLNEIENIIK